MIYGRNKDWFKKGSLTFKHTFTPAMILLSIVKSLKNEFY
jgi:hypothetical protein